MSRTGRVSAGLEILKRNRCPAAVSTRKFWSRSPASGGEGARDAERAAEDLPGGLVAERGRRTRQRIARQRVTGLRVAHHRARALHHRPEEYLAVARTS